MYNLFAKIGFNGSTVCEIDYDTKKHKFNIFWMNHTHNDLIKINEHNKHYTVNEWLDSLCVLLGYTLIQSTHIMVLKPKTSDLIYFDNLSLLNRPWDGFHNYHPDYTFEFGISSNT
jgi:hypothetical protein